MSSTQMETSIRWREGTMENEEEVGSAASTGSSSSMSPPPAVAPPPIVPVETAPPLDQPMPPNTYLVDVHPIGSPGSRRAGKTRSPWGVWLLSLVTFGIYFLYWYYKVNSEVREYDHSIDVQPGIAVLAQFIPIADLVSMVKTAGRISRAQRLSGTAHRCSGLLGFLLIFVFGTWIVYYQSQLNKVWDMHGNPPEHAAL